MEASAETAAFERGVTPLLKMILPGRTNPVLRYEPDASLQERIKNLASKSTEGSLSDSERAEYAGYVRANKFVAILKRQAERLTVSANGPDA